MSNLETQTLARINNLPLGEAVLEYQHLLAGDPNCQFAHRELGWALVQLSDMGDGELHIRRALELDPHDAWAHIFLGNVLWRKFEYADTETAFQTAVSLWPESSVPLLCLAVVYDYEKRQRLAGRYYRRALEIAPNDTAVLYRYGQFLRSQHRSAKARRIFERLLSIDEKSDQGWSELFEATLESRHH